MNRCYSIGLAAVLIMVLMVSTTRAGGLALYEISTPEVGLAAAGWSARAQDASTAFTNPAGMTRLNQSQMLGGIQPLYVNAQFDTDESSFGGGDGGNAGGWVPAAGLYYVHDLAPQWKLGVAAASYFGLGLDYDDSWSGRYYVTEAELLTFGISPTVAYEVSPRLSIGAGPTLMYGKLDQKAAINNAATGDTQPDGSPFPDGKLKFDEGDIGVGGVVGVLIEPRDDTRFGITYLFEVEFDFDDAASLNNLGPTLSSVTAGLRNTKVDLDLSIPQMLMASAYHDLTDKLALMANIGWQDWSAFGKQEFTLRSETTTSLTKDLNFKDTWHVAVGAQYRIYSDWVWSVGMAYDSSPVDDEDRTPDLPLDRQIRVGTGLQYHWQDNITVGLAYEYLDAGDAEIDQTGGPLQGNLEGDYDSNEIHFFNFNVIWKF